MKEKEDPEGNKKNKDDASSQRSGKSARKSTRPFFTSMDILEIKNKIRKIAKKYNLKLVLLFGSQVFEKTYNQSDIDIAYLSEKKISLNEEINLIFDLTQIFRSEDIDLVNLRIAPPLLFYAISQNSILLYQKDALVFPEFCALAFKYYIEAKPIFELQKILL